MVRLSSSILSGGTNQAPNYMPNAYGITDAGDNYSSDGSLTLATSTSQSDQTNLDQVLTSTGLDPQSGYFVGPTNIIGLGMVVLLLPEISSGQDTIPGVPGITFPGRDELLFPRSTPTSAGALELNPLTLPTNAITMAITGNSGSVLATNGQTNVQFSVEASINDTNDSLGYQWQMNGTNLVDGKNVSGSASNVLTIKKVTGANVGSYEVWVSPSMLIGFATSSVVSLTIYSNPAVAITSPTAGARTTNSLITGTAIGTPAVSNVTCWVSNLETGVVTTNQAVLAAGSATTTKWSLSNALSPGSNNVVAQSEDALGHFSPSASVKFFYIVPSRFALATNGSGKISGSASVAGNTPPTNGAALNIGETYTLTATPLAGGAFGNWTGTIAPTASNPLTFIMEPNMPCRPISAPARPPLSCPPPTRARPISLSPERPREHAGDQHSVVGNESEHRHDPGHQHRSEPDKLVAQHRPGSRHKHPHGAKHRHFQHRLARGQPPVLFHSDGAVCPDKHWKRRRHGHRQRIGFRQQAPDQRRAAQHRRGLHSDGHAGKEQLVHQLDFRRLHEQFAHPSLHHGERPVHSGPLRDQPFPGRRQALQRSLLHGDQRRHRANGRDAQRVDCQVVGHLQRQTAAQRRPALQLDREASTCPAMPAIASSAPRRRAGR